MWDLDPTDFLSLVPILGVALVMYFVFYGTEPRRTPVKFQAQPYYR